MNTIVLPLGTIDPSRETGWYKDDVTGQLYYYDADTKKWSVYSAGYLYPLSIAEESAPKTIAVAVGDKVKITISYKYVGPASASVEEYFSIGNKDIFGYHPRIVGTNTRNLPLCLIPTSFSSDKTLNIPVDVHSNWNHIECKVWHGSPDVPETGLKYINALEIIGLVAEITAFTIADYSAV